MILQCFSFYLRDIGTSKNDVEHYHTSQEMSSVVLRYISKLESVPMISLDIIEFLILLLKVNDIFEVHDIYDTLESM